MKIGLYSITYRGVWYRGEALDVFSLVRLAKQQGWEGLELDAERPHAAPMDLSREDRKRLRDLAAELGIELCAVSPNCDLSSPVPVQRETMISYVRECIKLAHDLGSPICKIFAAWRGITLHDGLATYDETYGYNQYGFWKSDRRGFVLDSVKEAGIDMQLRAIDVNQLLDADEVFITNSIMGIMPVCRLERKVLGDDKPGLVTRKLSDRYASALKEGE